MVSPLRTHNRFGAPNLLVADARLKFHPGKRVPSLSDILVEVAKLRIERATGVAAKREIWPRDPRPIPEKATVLVIKAKAEAICSIRGI